MTPTAAQRRLAELIANSNFTVALTGAGISTASGIPDFRGPQGLWRQVDPMTVAHIDVWRNDPERFWAYYRERLDIGNYEPNAAHEALAALERRGLLAYTITQNIDGLHQRAGCENVMELHGSVADLVCLSCQTRVERSAARALFGADGVPWCPTCQQAGQRAALKPDVVLFGEMLSSDFNQATALCGHADLLLCIGSSLVVAPVSQLPLVCRHDGGQLAILTQSETPYDEDAAVKLDGNVAEELPGVLAALDELGVADRPRMQINFA